MPAVPPGQPIAPGVGAPPTGYPEYGVGGGTPGNSAGWNIVVANNAQQKITYAQQGYLVWFSSRAAAQQFISSQSSSYGSGEATGPLAPLADIGNFFHALTEPATWVRVGEVGVGVLLLFVGVRALSQGSSVAGSQARKAAGKPIKKVGKTVAKVAVPELRVAGRVASKRVAPRTTARVASHRAHVAKYGAKTPYKPPTPKPPPAPKQPTVRISHIYHHKPPTAPKKVAAPKKVGP